MLVHAKGPEVVDTIHGIVVNDPYRWLENRTSAETEEWIAVQHRRLEGYMDRCGSRETLHKWVLQVADIEKVDEIGRIHDRVFYRKRSPGRQQPGIFCMDLATRSERLLVDPSQGGPFRSVSIHSISRDGKLLSYQVKTGGEHAKAIYVVEVDTGKPVPDHLETGLGRGFVFQKAGEGFYFCHEPIADSPRVTSDHVIFRHRFGTSAASDIPLLALPRTELSKLVLKGDGEMLGAVYAREEDGVLVVDFYKARQDADSDWKCVCRRIPAPFIPFFHRDRLFAHFFQNRPNGEIVELDSETGVPVLVSVPEWLVQTSQTIAVQNRFYVSYVVGTETRVRVWSLNGEYEGELSLERGRTWSFAQIYSGEAEDLFLQYESFTEPPSIIRYRPKTSERAVWTSSTAFEPRRPVEIRKVIYEGKDRTRIDMSLVGKRYSSAGSDQPVIMTGYGGFGVTLTPQFSAFVSVLHDLGFLFALPQIRGGGERGKAWHEAARGRNRQVAFDDFIAAAEWLCAEGLTSPSKLAIFGGSNSGTLVGASITQRPDLFRAAICIAPLLDMVRYHVFDCARIWSDEYGTSENREDFLALYAYSPYHNIREDTNYPAMLFVCGDRDTRCNPAHARKMAAYLAGRAAQRNTILLDHVEERGHSPTLPLATRVTGIVHRIAFLCNELGISISEEALDGSGS